MPGLAWMLDTDTLSSLVRDPRNAVFDRLQSIGPDAACTSIVVACELRFGARRKGSRVLTRRVGQLLDALAVLPLDAAADAHYAEIRAALERAGKPIGNNDLLIAAHARSRELTLVTHNIREFDRIPGLRVADWLAASP